MNTFKKIIKIIFSTISFVILSGITSILLFVVFNMLFGTIADRDAIKGVPKIYNCTKNNKDCDSYLNFYYENDIVGFNIKINDIKGNTIFASNGYSEFLLDENNNVITYYYPNEAHHMSRAIYNKNNEIIMEMGNKFQGGILWVNEYIRK